MYGQLLSAREDQSLYTPVSLHGVIVFFVLGSTEDLEARAIKSSLQTKAPGDAWEGASQSRRVTGLAETAGAGKTRRVFINESKAIIKKRSIASTKCNYS